MPAARFAALFRRNGPYALGMLGAIEWLSVGGYATMGVAAVVLVIAIVGDRSRGRRRCRNCWYDMSAAARPTSVSPVICPECGTRTITDRQLSRSRRSWSCVSITVLALFLGWYSTVVALRRNAMGSPWIPTSLLVCLAPIEPSGQAGLLFNSLVDRLGTMPREGGAWDWQRSILAWRQPKPSEDAFNHAIVTRRRWPSGSTPLFKLDPSVFESSSVGFAFVRAEVIDADVTTFDLRLRAEHPRLWRTLPPGNHERFGIGRELASGHYAMAFRVTHAWEHGPERVGICRVEFDVAPPGEVVLPPCEDQRIDAAVRCSLRWQVYTDRVPEWTRMQWRFDEDMMWKAAWDFVPRGGPYPIVALTIEVLDGEHLVHSATMIYLDDDVGRTVEPSLTDFTGLVEPAPTADQDQGMRLKPGVIERLRVRVRSSEAIAARSLGAPCHWSGQFEAPLTDFMRAHD